MSYADFDKDILQTLLDAQPSLIAVIDSAGKIAAFKRGNANHQRHSNLIGKNFVHATQKFLGGNAVPILQKYHACVTMNQSMEIVRFALIILSGATEYYNIKFNPVQNGAGTIIHVQNVSESVFLEQEFSSVTEQYETVNRELSSAMSNLDFHLMDLEQAHKKLAALYRITSIVQSTVDEQEVLEEILDGITGELSFANAAILLLDETKKELTIRAQRGYSTKIDHITIPVGSGITGNAVLKRDLIYVPDVNADPRYIPGTFFAVSEVAVPLIVNGRVLGVLDVETSEDRCLQTFDLDLLRSLASQIAITISHAQHVACVQVQAITDGLTGLYNYRYFQTLLPQEIKRAARYRHPLSMLMLDIDFFKNYNDEYGHLRGDEALRTVADIIHRSCRDVDHVFRYGGEEFAVLLPETDLADAALIAERIRRTVAEHAFTDNSGCTRPLLTISIGVAAYPSYAQSELELMELADKALYRAKDLFRNRVALCTEYNG